MRLPGLTVEQTSKKKKKKKNSGLPLFSCPDV